MPITLTLAPPSSTCCIRHVFLSHAGNGASSAKWYHPYTMIVVIIHLWAAHAANCNNNKDTEDTHHKTIKRESWWREERCWWGDPSEWTTMVAAMCFTKWARFKTEFMRAFWTRMRNNDCVSCTAWLVAYVALYWTKWAKLFDDTPLGVWSSWKTLQLNERDRGEVVFRFSGVAAKKMNTLYWI